MADVQQQAEAPPAPSNLPPGASYCPKHGAVFFKFCASCQLEQDRKREVDEDAWAEYQDRRRRDDERRHEANIIADRTR